LLVTKLWERRFEISHFYASGVPFPFERFEFDPRIYFRKKGAEECTACFAVESEDPLEERGPEQEVSDIATIYSLVTGHSFSVAPGGASGLESLQQLGRGQRIKMVLSTEPVYSKEDLQRHSDKLIASLEKTRNVWGRVRQILAKKDFLRLALFYYYRSGLHGAAFLERCLDAVFIDAVIGLEALYNDGPQDIAYKLAARAALVLSCSEQRDQQNRFSRLKELYKKRNNIIHGKKREHVRWDDYHEVRQYLRNSLRSCLSLGLEKDKEQILSLVDKALIELMARQELTSAIQNGLLHLGL